MSGSIFSVRHDRFRASFARLPDRHVNCPIQTQLVLAIGRESLLR